MTFAYRLKYRARFSAPGSFIKRAGKDRWLSIDASGKRHDLGLSDKEAHRIILVGDWTPIPTVTTVEADRVERVEETK